MIWQRIQLALLTGLLIATGSSIAQGAQPITKMYVDNALGSNALYAISGATDPTADLYGLFRSTDNGSTWSPVGEIPLMGAQPAVVTAVTSTFDIELNHYLFIGTKDEGVFRSVDHGQTWEVWNDANFSIAAMDAGIASDPVVAISEDGFLYTSFDQGDNWLALAVFLDAISLALNGQNAIIGSRSGDVFDVRNPAGSAQFMTPASLGGPVEHVARTMSQAFAVVNHADGSGRRLHRGTGFDNRDWSEMLVDGNSTNISSFAVRRGFVFIINEGANRDFMIYNLETNTWTTSTLPVADGIEHLATASCSTENCIPSVFLSTKEGGFRSDDAGQTWIQLGELIPPPPPPIIIANTDLGVAMVSPASTMAMISNTTSRFVLNVTNHGSERVEDVRVGLNFTSWRDGSTQGSSSFGTSTTINGIDCSPDVNRILFPRKILQCELDALEPGQSARIEWIHGLAEDTFSMRIEAEVASEKLRDDNPNNDRLEFSPSVRTAIEANSNNVSGGGGAFGIWTLLAICGFLFTVRIRRFAGKGVRFILLIRDFARSAFADPKGNLTRHPGAVFKSIEQQ